MTQDELDSDRLWRQIQLVMNERFTKSIWFWVPVSVLLFAGSLAVLGYVDIRGVKVDVQSDGARVREVRTAVVDQSAEITRRVREAEGTVANLSRRVEVEIGAARNTAETTIEEQISSLQKKLEEYSGEVQDLKGQLSSAQNAAQQILGLARQVESTNLAEVPTLKKQFEGHMRDHQTNERGYRDFRAGAVGFGLCLLALMMIAGAWMCRLSWKWRTAFRR